MFQKIKDIFIFVLILQIVSLPLAAPECFAASKKTIAVVEVFKNKPSNDLSLLRHELERTIMRSKKMQLVVSSRVAAYFNHGKTDSPSMTEGDILYREAEDLFMAFKNHQALDVLTLCTSELNKKPGISGTLVKAYLLKAQIKNEIGKYKEAFESMVKAVSYNLSQKKLDTYVFSPRTRRLFEKARRKYIVQTKISDLTVNVKGKKKSPIYINGVFRGNGPLLIVKVPENHVQFVSTGTAVTSFKKTSKKEITLAARNSSRFSKEYIGFKNGDSKHLLIQARDLGQKVRADYVALMSLSESNAISKIKLIIVDVKKGLYSKTKVIDVKDAAEDANKTAKRARQFIASLSRNDFSKIDMQFAKKKINKNTLIYSAIGAVVLGVGIGTALALSSGSGEPSVSTSPVSVSGPGAR